MSVTHFSEAKLPTKFGAFTVHVFRTADGLEHMALAAGDVRDECLVRIHSECATGDILRSQRCDCGDQLELALQDIQAAGEGLFIYLRGQEGRGIGLGNKIKAYALQDQGADTVDANVKLGFPVDAREYASAIGILNYFGVRRVRLMTNNQQKVAAMAAGGIEVSERVPLFTALNPHNMAYLDTKREKLGHSLPLLTTK